LSYHSALPNHEFRSPLKGELQTMKSTKSNASGKRLLQAAAMLVMLVALAISPSTAPTGNAQSSGIEFIFDVLPETPALSTSLTTGTTFYLQGKAYPFRTLNQADCTFRSSSPRQVGTWRAWGQVADDGRLVMNQSLKIDNVGGMIEVQGTTGVPLAGGEATPAIAGTIGAPFTGPSEVLAVTGGVGAYRALNGEAQVRGYCVQDTTVPFRYDRGFCLNILEGKRK
jgi:hypothetical protein